MERNGIVDFAPDPQTGQISPEFVTSLDTYDVLVEHVGPFVPAQRPDSITDAVCRDKIVISIGQPEPSLVPGR